MEAGSAYAPSALDAPYPGEPDGVHTLLDTLGGEDGGFELVRLRESLKPALRALPERERRVLAAALRASSRT